MTASTKPARFPASGSVLAQTATAVLSYGLALAATWLVHRQFNAQEALAATLLAWAVGLVALLPVAGLGPLGPVATVWGFFLGEGLRVMLGLVGWFMLSRQVGLDLNAMLVASVVATLPLLFVHAGIVARYMWQRNIHAHVEPPATPAGSTTEVMA